MYLFLPDCHKLSAAASTKQWGKWLWNVNSDQSLVSGNLAYIYLLQIALASSLSNLFRSFEKIKFESLVEDMKSLLFTLTGDVLYRNQIKMNLCTCSQVSDQLSFMSCLPTINNSIKHEKAYKSVSADRTFPGGVVLEKKKTQTLESTDLTGKY